MKTVCVTDESLLSSAQKKAIDKALENVTNNRTITHDQALKQIKTKFPKYSIKQIQYPEN